MKEELFFSQLVSYFKEYTQTPIKIQRSYQVNNYAIIGEYEKRNAPTITLHHDSFRGSLHCYYVVFKGTSNPEYKKLLNEYAKHIINTLESIFQNEPFGYALYRKVAKTTQYSLSSRDCFTKILKNTHFPMSSEDNFKFMFTPGTDLTNRIKWLYFSKHPNTIDNLNRIIEVYKHVNHLLEIKQISEAPGSYNLRFNNEKNTISFSISYKEHVVTFIFYGDKAKQTLKMFIDIPQYKDVYLDPSYIDLNKSFILYTEVKELIEKNKIALLLLN